MQIFENFYRRIMPMFPPQAEQVLDVIKPEELDKVSFRYTFSVEAMTNISHIIEDTARNSPGVADLHVSFQYLSRVRDQQERYVDIANKVKGLWLYGAPDIPEIEVSKVLNKNKTRFIDTADSPLLDYWFLIAYGPGIHKLLLAQEIPSLSGSGRYYEGFFTFDPYASYEILNILHQLYPGRIGRPLSPSEME